MKGRKEVKFKIFSMFDGVGGFVVGLDNANKKLNKKTYQTMYTNQFEPSRKSQDAYEVGLYNYPEINHSNVDIMEVPNEEFEEMKNQGVNLICAGFPCQDYSVARSKKHEMGIQGKKGVLFWEIIRATNHIKPEYLILENVDRLLKSPSKQRGRDFAIMLAAFNQLGYSVEWRVINAADYGRAQRRRRVFFFVFRNDTSWAKKLDKIYGTIDSQQENLLLEKQKYDSYIFSEGLFARQFPIKQIAYKNRQWEQKLSKYSPEDEENYVPDVSDNFTGKVWNTGIMRHGEYYTIDTEPTFSEEPITLGEIIRQAEKVESVDEKYYILDKVKLEKFEYLRGSKKIERTSENGHTYIFSEGSMSPHDSLELPARTMLTSEGSVNRSTHFLYHNERHRLLTPIEAELLQDFPPNWTKYKRDKETGEIKEVADRMRMFFMGNALVTGIVTRIGIELEKITEENK